MVAVRLYGDGGTRYDPHEKSGLCYFMAKMLTRGAGDLTANDIDRRVEDMGAVLSSGSGRNSYYLRGDSLKGDFERLMELVATVLTRPGFPEEEIAKLKQDTLSAIERQDENWAQEMDRLFRQNQFVKHHMKNDISWRQRLRFRHHPNRARRFPPESRKTEPHGVGCFWGRYAP